MVWKKIVLLCAIVWMTTLNLVLAESSSKLQLRNTAVTAFLHEKNVTCIERDITRFSPLNGQKYWINSHDVRQLIFGLHGSIFVATYGGGISKYNPITENFSPLFREKTEKYMDVESLVDTPEYLWFTTPHGGVGSYRKSTGEFENWLSDNKKNAAVTFPTDIITVSNGDIWFGAKLGLYRIQPETRQIDVFTPPHGEQFGPSALTVRALHKLSNERLVLETKSGHLSYSDISDQRFAIDSKLHDKHFTTINNIAVFEEKISLATEFGLVAFDESNGELTTYFQRNSSLSNNQIKRLKTDGERLWIGTYFGLDIIFASSFEIFDTLNSRVDNDVMAFAEDSTGRLWVSTYNGMYFKDNGSKIHQPIESLHPNIEFEDSRIMSSAVKENELWLGFRNDGLQIIDLTDGTSAKPIILSIMQDRGGSILIGTLGQGLFSNVNFSGNDKRIFTSTIPDITVYAIVNDDEGHQWISTTQGLLQLDIAGSILKKYTVAHGLQDNDFNFGASHKDSQGRLYFGGSKGYNRFDPKQLESTSTPPKVVLTSLKVAGEEPSLPVALQALEKLQLSHNDYFFTISFSALDFLEPSKNQYSYKLENFDSDWIDNGTRNSATYTNLPPGNYTFRVRGANSAGVWNLEGASLEIQVLPPLWFTWWAIVCYALATFAAVLYGKKIYDDRLIAKNVAIQAEQMQHAADRANDDLQEQLEIQDALVRSVYKHNMTTLDLVKNLHCVRADYLSDPSLVESFESDQNRLVALSFFESCVLYQDEVLYADLKKYTDMAIGLVLKSANVAAESITTINDVSNKMMPVEIATPLAMVIFELLDNCVSHAFEPGGPANYIQISLDSQFDTTSQSPQISLVVTDNGMGFPTGIPQEELESTGLALVRSVIDKFQGELTISTVNPGARVEILLPNSPDLIAPYGNRS